VDDIDDDDDDIDDDDAVRSESSPTSIGCKFGTRLSCVLVYFVCTYCIFI
jgi:hypothetical protein